jgi:hypothetical protein
MKVLGWIALVLGLAAVAAGIYSKVETYPNLQYAEGLVAEGSADVLDVRLASSYRAAIDQQHLVSWAAGGLAFILGLVAFAKSRSKVALVATVLGIGGAALTILSGAIR